MLTNSKYLIAALSVASLVAISGCASQAPRVSNSALGFAITNYAISADANEEALSNALGSALGDVGIATAMPAKAEVTIDFVRYDAPFIGFFYGGQHYANLSVVLTDSTGSRISSFPLYVAADGDRVSADADLAQAAAQIIAAKAANAYMPIKKPKPAPKPMAAPMAAPISPAPVVDAVAPADDASPCVIDADGKCVEL
jgi:hypothetical protein